MVVPSMGEALSVPEATDKVLNMEMGPEDDVPVSQEDNLLTEPSQSEESQDQDCRVDSATVNGPLSCIAAPFSNLDIDKDEPELLD